ncbi:hypothetical protein Srufu_077820 [Streptomyces libani subsp. rufus]|nr:hypothetical protein Srufu_077820 [Streptomyces libani subsp. rufus]
MSNDQGPAAAPEEGAGGGWYVDARCTNCDVARQLAPTSSGNRTDGRK